MLKKRKQNKNEIIENPAVSKGTGIVITIVMTLLAVAFLFPIFLVLMNSFKNKLYISDAPFALPNSDTFSGMYNYVNGIQKTGLAGSSRKICFYYHLLCNRDRAADIHGRMVDHKSYMQIIHSIVLSVCICNDRSIPDGYVYTV